MARLRDYPFDVAEIMEVRMPIGCLDVMDSVLPYLLNRWSEITHLLT